MATTYKNKIIFAGEVLMDLTGDTVTAATMLSGTKAHDKSGAPITGTCTYDANTQDGTATASEILNTKTAYVRGAKVTGSMPNRGAATGTISTKTGSYTIQQGYHDGSGKVTIASTEQAKLIPENIREGITILGIQGTMSGTEGETVEATKTVTPTKDGFSVTPSEGYTCMGEVVVAAIPYSENANSAGGLTVTIG